MASGARAASSPGEGVRQCEVLRTMLPDSADVQPILAGASGRVRGASGGDGDCGHEHISPMMAWELPMQR